MEDLLGCFVTVFLAVIYIAAVIAFFTYVAGVVVAVVCLYVAGDLLWGYFRRAHGVLVRRTAEFELIAPYRPETPENGPEPAYRQYFFGPAMRDLRQIITHGWQHGTTRAVTHAERFTGWTFTSPPVPVAVTWPVGVAMLTGLGVGMGAGGAMVGALAMLHACGAICVQFIARWCVAVLRAADTFALAVRGVRGMRCPWCYEKNRYPAYRCRCDRLHRDIRPGRYGVFRRRCACGERIPTLILLGSYRLNAYCVYCDRQMSDEVGRFPELELPLLGGRAAGKTRLMAAMLLDLTGHANGADMLLASAEARRDYDVNTTVLDDQGYILATTRELPHAHALRLTDGRRTRLVHIFDPAGERLVDRNRTDELRYHKSARTFVFVLDPMSVKAFKDSLPPAEREGLDFALASTVHPQDVYDQAVQQVLAMGGQLRRSRLAVAISKTDLIQHTVLMRDRADTDEWARSWVIDTLGLGNLVRSMDHQFREVRFFFTAAVTVAPRTVDPSVRPLVEWALDLSTPAQRRA